MPKLEALQQYDEQKNKEAKDFYNQEYMTGGSLQNEFLNVKTNDTEKNYDLLHGWYSKKLNDVSKELDEAKTDEQALHCQNKMLAYYQIFKENTYDIFEDYRRQKAKEGNKDFIRFSTPKPLAALNKETASKFAIRESGLRSFEEKVDRTAVQKMEKQKAEEEYRKKKDAVSKDVSNRKKDYRVDVYGKYQELQDKYNDAFRQEVTVEGSDWRSAVRGAKKYAGFQDKNQSILDMVENYRKNVIAPGSDRISAIESETVKESREEMENVMFNVDGRVDNEKYSEGMERYERDLNEASVQAHAAAADLTRAKMALYAETKKRMDGRGLLSKLFHPSRTKQENAMFAEMREDVKNALGANDDYMNRVDGILSDSKKSFDDLAPTTGTQQLCKVDYSSMVKAQTDLFGQKQLENELNKVFGKQPEKNDLSKAHPEQPQKQLQQNGPKVE